LASDVSFDQVVVRCSCFCASFQTVRLYDTNHNLLKLQVDQKAAVLDVCFDDDDGKAFAVGLDQAVTAIDLRDGRKTVLGHHGAASKCVVWHSGTQMLFSGGWDGKIFAWDTRQSKQVQQATPQDGQKVRFDRKPKKTKSNGRAASVMGRSPFLPLCCI
jgi:WD40 repeat protein